MQTNSAVIFDIDHFAVHDGPGIRTVIYFKGCPLRCLWCHSPESQKMQPEYLFIEERCKGCANCLRENCPNGATLPCGREMTMQQLLNEVEPDRVFFESSGGGVTLTGGEVLSQAAFARELLRALRETGIHSVVETSGMGETKGLLSLSPFTDIFYYDIKAMDDEKHKRFTGVSLRLIHENLEALVKLRKGEGIVLRVPLIPSLNDSREDVQAVYALALRLGLKQVHLLPYNSSAPAKYQWLGQEYPLPKLLRQADETLFALQNLAPPELAVEIS